MTDRQCHIRKAYSMPTIAITKQEFDSIVTNKHPSAEQTEEEIAWYGSSDRSWVGVVLRRRDDQDPRPWSTLIIRRLTQVPGGYEVMRVHVSLPTRGDAVRDVRHALEQLDAHPDIVARLEWPTIIAECPEPILHPAWIDSS